MHAGDFFSEIGGHANVEPVPGNGAFENVLALIDKQGACALAGVWRNLGAFLYDELKARERRGNLVEGKIQPQRAANLGRRDVDIDGLLWDGIAVDSSGHDASAAELGDQFCGAARRDLREPRRDSP